PPCVRSTTGRATRLRPRRSASCAETAVLQKRVDGSLRDLPPVLSPHCFQLAAADQLRQVLGVQVQVVGGLLRPKCSPGLVLRRFGGGTARGALGREDPWPNQKIST